MWKKKFYLCSNYFFANMFETMGFFFPRFLFIDFKIRYNCFWILKKKSNFSLKNSYKKFCNFLCCFSFQMGNYFFFFTFNCILIKIFFQNFYKTSKITLNKLECLMQANLYAMNKTAWNNRIWSRYCFFVKWIILFSLCVRFEIFSISTFRKRNNLRNWLKEINSYV